MHKIIKEEGNLLRVDVSGKLTQADYDELVPSWKRMIARHGSMRLLLVMTDFLGWDPAAAWEDFRFDWEHGKQVERVAMVGEKKWQEWMTKLGAIIAATEVKYFDHADLASAERWVTEG